MSEYQITGMFRKMVRHNCPACGTPLENSLEGAGQQDNCPKCNHEFIIPGGKELDAIKRAEVEKKIEKRQAQIEKAKEKMQVRTQQEEQVQWHNANLNKGETDGIREVPAYAGLNIVGRASVVIGWITIAGGPAIGLSIIASNIGKPDNQLGNALAAGIVLTGGGLICGIALVATGNAIDALRDIAMNSFHSANKLHSIHSALNK